MAAKAGTAYVDFQADLSSLNKQVAAAVAPLSSKFGKLGKAGAVGLGAIAVGGAVAGKALYDLGSQFDDAYDTIRDRTGKTGKQLDRLKNDFKNVVGSMPVDFDEAAQAVGGLSQRLDIAGKPLRRLSKQVLALSKITGEDLSQEIPAITRLFGDWSVKTNQQAETLDKLYRLTTKTGIGFSDLSELMVQFGSPLRQLGFRFDEAAVMFARFEKEGVNMQTLLPGLRFALKNISLPTNDLAATFKRLGVSTKDPHDALLQIFDVISSSKVSQADKTLLASGVFGGRAWADMKAAIEEGRFSFNALIRDMEKGSTTIRGTEKGTRDASENFKIMSNRLKVLLEPAANAVFKAVADLSLALTKLSFKDLIRELGLTEGDMRALSKVVTVVVKAFRVGFKIAGDQVKAFLQGFRGSVAVIRGIVKLIGAILRGDFGDAWKQVKAIFRGGAQIVLAEVRGMTAPIRAVSGVIGKALADPLDSAWDRVRSIFTSGANAVKDVFRGLGKSIAGVARGIGLAIFTAAFAIKKAAEWIVKAVKKIVGAFGDLADKIPDVSLPSLPSLPSVPGLQRGGPINLGKASGDSVPALLERGEYVLNRKAVRAVGVSALDQLNFQQAKRFQRGGATIPRINVSGNGVPQALAQSGIDRMRGAANKFIGKQQPKGGAGGFGGPAPQDLQAINKTYPRSSVSSPGARLSSATMRRLMAWAGLPSPMLAIAERESGWHPGIVSYDGGYGLWQITPRVHDAAHIALWNRIGSYFNPLANARMARVLYGESGLSPWSATAQRGGLIGMQRGGRIGQFGDDRFTKTGSPPPPLPRGAGGGPGNFKGNPRSLARVMSVANYVNRLNLPYIFGGGHNGTPASLGSGVDCSGAISYLVQNAGWDMPTTLSGSMVNWFKPGRGDGFTILANPEHVYAVINGKAWGAMHTGTTVGYGWDYTYLPGFTERHPVLGPGGGDGGGGGGAGGTSGPKAPPKPHPVVTAGGVGVSPDKGGAQAPQWPEPPTIDFGGLPRTVAGCTKEINRLRGKMYAAQDQLRKLRTTVIGGLHGVPSDKGLQAAIGRWKAYVGKLQTRINALVAARNKLIAQAIRANLSQTRKSFSELPEWQAKINPYTDPNSGKLVIDEEQVSRITDLMPSDVASPEMPESIKDQAAFDAWVGSTENTWKFWQTAQVGTNQKYLSDEWTARNLLAGGEGAARSRISLIERVVDYLKAQIAKKSSTKKQKDTWRDLIKTVWRPAQANLRALGIDPRSDWQTNLLALQGHGYTHDILRTLPAFPPGFGYGAIFQTQKTIFDLLGETFERPVFEASELPGGDGGGGGADSGDASAEAINNLLAQQLEEAQRTIRLFNLQSPVAADFPVLHGGGIYQAPPGYQEGGAILRDREGVFTEEQMAAMGGGDINLYADVYIGGEKIDERVEMKLRKAVRNAQRNSPSSMGRQAAIA